MHRVRAEKRRRDDAVEAPSAGAGEADEAPTPRKPSKKARQRAAEDADEL